MQRIVTSFAAAAALVLAGCASPAQVAQRECADLAINSTRAAYLSCLRIIQRREERAWQAIGEIGDSLSKQGDAMLSHPAPTLVPPPAAPTGSTGMLDLYSVNHGDVRLGSPDGPVIGQTTRIGDRAPSVVVMPVPVPSP